MKTARTITFSILAVLALGQAQPIADDKPAKSAPTAWITGTEPGWRAMTEDDFVNVNCADDTWSFEDNLIKCTGKPVGVIRTKKQVTNLELVVEWKHKQYGGNSGVFLWAMPESIKKLKAGQGRLPAGIEVQVLDLGSVSYTHLTLPTNREV